MLLRKAVRGAGRCNCVYRPAACERIRDYEQMSAQLHRLANKSKLIESKDRKKTFAKVRTSSYEGNILDIIGSSKPIDPDSVRDIFIRNPKTRTAIFEQEAVWTSTMFIRAARAATKMSQAELGRAIGVSQARIAFLESGSARRGPSFALLARVAHACGKKLSLTML